MSEATRYREAKRIFLESCDLDARGRAEVLGRRCGGDDDLRREVESLLAHHDRTCAGAKVTAARRSDDDGEPPTIDGAPRFDGVTAQGPARPVSGDAAGMRIGPYRIIHEIGRGAFGVVYLGVREDERFRRRVAIKILKRGLDTEDILRRFELERQVLSAMNHPGIARLYDAGETEDGRPWFAMEHVEGQPIDRWCDSHRLTIGERLVLFRAVCEAVHSAHQNLVVHRDLKPANILVTHDGRPKLLDFGIAKIVNPDFQLVDGDPTAPELRVMTPEYASPEQVRGDVIGTASDVYSLGVILYELLTGHRPYRLRTRLRDELVRLICEEDPLRPSTAITTVDEIDGPPADDGPRTTRTVDLDTIGRARGGRTDRLARALAGDLDNIVLMAMRKEAQRRYRSAEQLAEDIDRHLRGLPVIARPDTLSYRASKFVRRNRWGVGAAALIALLLVGGVVGTSTGAVRARRGERAAREAQTAAEQARVEATTARGEAEEGRRRAEQLRAAAEAARAAEARAAVEAREQQALAVEASEAADRHFDASLALARTMLVDFYDHIKKLDGAMEARALLADTAHEYLLEAEQEVGESRELRDLLADSWDKLGQIASSVREGGIGDTAASSDHHRRALALREQLIAENPDDVETRRGLFATLTYIGDFEIGSGATNSALEHYERTLTIAESLVRSDPSWQHRRRVAIALLNRGEALLEMGETGAGRADYERSLSIRESLLRERPEDALARRDLSRALVRVAWRDLEAGETGAARTRAEHAIALDEASLAADGDNRQAYRHLAVTLGFAARICVEDGDPPAAMAHVERAERLLERQARENPTLAEARFDLATCGHLPRGEVLVALERWSEAGQALEQARTILVELVERDPINATWRSTLADMERRLGRALAAGGSVEVAEAHLRSAIEAYDRLVRADSNSAAWPEAAASVRVDLGALLADQSRWADALRTLDDAVTALRPLMVAQSRNADIRTDLARALRRLADAERAVGDDPAAVRHDEEADALIADAPRVTPGLEALRR